MTVKIPPPLKPGDTIGIMAPSSRVESADVGGGAAVLRQRGYKVFIHPQCAESLSQSAGTPEQKVAALHDLATNPDIKGVFFAGGGNRALQMLDLLDYRLIGDNPKTYMGFSDCTALLNAITAKCGLVTYHGPVVKRLPSNLQIDANFNLLEGNAKSIPLPGARFLKTGTAKGPLFGGNLSLIRAMRADDLPAPKGAILFLEEISEELSKIDRDLIALRRSDLFEQLGGIIFGQFTNLTDTGQIPFGFSFEDVILEHTQGLDIPILINAPFGHDKDLNYALPIGQTITISGEELIL